MEEFVKHLVEMEMRIVEALVYSARAQGFRAGVRPYVEQDPELAPLVKRAVFIEYPEKTIEWGYPEIQAEFLNRFTQYES
jgi:hypothetical protein